MRPTYIQFQVSFFHAQIFKGLFHSGYYLIFFLIDFYYFWFINSFCYFQQQKELTFDKQFWNTQSVSMPLNEQKR